eukprot:2661783-Prymnesium_polylepis.1
MTLSIEWRADADAGEGECASASCACGRFEIEGRTRCDRNGSVPRRLPSAAACSLGRPAQAAPTAEEACPGHLALLVARS